jgi:hypothetical protein
MINDHNVIGFDNGSITKECSAVDQLREIANDILKKDIKVESSFHFRLKLTNVY